MPLPRDKNNKIDYDKLKFFFDKHNSFENFGKNEEILPELEKFDYALFTAYRSYLYGYMSINKILDGRIE